MPLDRPDEEPGTPHHARLDAREYEVLVPVDGGPDARLVYRVWATDESHAGACARERFREYQLLHPGARVGPRGVTVGRRDRDAGGSRPLAFALSRPAARALTELQALLSRLRPGARVPGLDALAKVLLERTILATVRRLRRAAPGAPPGAPPTVPERKALP